MSVPRATGAVAGAAAALLAFGCQAFAPSLRVPGYLIPPPRETTQPLAAAAAVEITPPPGFPTGGHGPAGAVARGYWTRLWARAFFFQDAQGHAVLLASCELFAVPAGLQAEVAARAAKAAARFGISLPPEAVIVAATHTHHGPGNFLSASVYNQFGSSRPGFSRKLHEFLAERIGLAAENAIARAAADPRPFVLVRRTGSLDHGFALNRGPRSFLLNRDQREILAALGNPDTDCTPRELDPPAGWDLPGCPRLRAVDRTLTVLEIRREEGAARRVEAILVFGAVHPTALLPSAPVYSSDFVGIAMRRIERSEGIVAGFFNGAEGDVVARRGRRDVADVLGLASAFRESVDAARRSDERMVPTSALRVSGCDLEPDRGAVRCGGESRDGALSTDPMMGVATLGGAEGDRTALYDLGFRDGSRDIPHYGQGVKRGALDSPLLPGLRLTRLFAPASTFPKSLPVRWVDFGGELVLGAVPVEMTTAQGIRIRRVLGEGAGRFHLVGLANEYASYASTCDEYAGQDYMAASTIWGPNEGETLGWALETLRGAAPAQARQVPRRTLRPGPASPARREFGPEFLGDERPHPDDELEEVLLRLDGTPHRNLPSIAWTEPAARDPFIAGRLRRIEVQEKAPDGSWRCVDDDGGESLVTVVMAGRGKGETRWAALWLGPLLASDWSRGMSRLCLLERDNPQSDYVERQCAAVEHRADE